MAPLQKEANLASLPWQMTSVEVYAIDLPFIATSAMQQMEQGKAGEVVNALTWDHWSLADTADGLQLATRM